MELTVNWHLLNCLAEIANQAGRAIMAVYETDFEHRLKADDSPVTEADIRADQIVRARQAGAATGISFVCNPQENRASYLDKSLMS